MARRILFIRLSALGDIVVTLPALAALRRHEPDALVDWLVEDRFAGLLRYVDGLHRVITFPRKQFKSPLSAMATLPRHLEALRAERYDAIVDFQANLKGALQLVCARSPLKIGLDKAAAREGSHRFADVRVHVRRDAHRVVRALSLLAPLGIDVEPIDHVVPDALHPRFVVPDDLANTIAARLDARGDRSLPLVALHPGTSAFGAFKRWPAERFGELAHRLARLARVVVVHGPGEDELANGVVRASHGSASIVSTEEGIGALLAVAQRVALYVGADSGPLLLAAAAGASTVALFGPKDPAIYAPPFARSAVVRHFVPCAPCSLRRCADPICMTRLDVDAVERACTAALRAGTAVSGLG
ncbi:MAG: glycosyltransferase family 9 protein [Planctomycetes bacterium]|nr:glycosyltransferase family 9 protein [Planctomycetota bacterium]